MHVTIYDPGNFTPYYLENLSNALAGLGIEVELITSPALFEDVGHHPSIRVSNHFFKLTAGAGRPSSAGMRPYAGP